MKKFQANFPDGKFKDKLAGVYKINFDNGKFYIGSSLHLRQRASSWKSLIESGKLNFHLGKSVRDMLFEINEAHFDVIEYVDDLNKVRDVETEYLMENIDNPQFINCAYTSRKGVVKYNTSFEDVESYVSIKEASRKNNCKMSKIQEALNGARKFYHGFGYRFNDEQSNVKSKRDKEIYDSKEGLRIGVIKGLASGLEIIQVSKKLGVYVTTVQHILQSFRAKYKAKTTYQLMAILGREGVV